MRLYSCNEINKYTERVRAFVFRKNEAPSREYVARVQPDSQEWISKVELESELKELIPKVKNKKVKASLENLLNYDLNGFNRFTSMELVCENGKYYPVNRTRLLEE